MSHPGTCLRLRPRGLVLTGPVAVLSDIAVYRPLSKGTGFQVRERPSGFLLVVLCGTALANSNYGSVPHGIERIVCRPDQKQKIAQAVRGSAEYQKGNRTRTQILLMGDVLIDCD